MSGSVIIYNLGATEELGRVSVQHAIKMVYKNVARIYETVQGETFGPYAVPKAVELLKYVYARWKYDRTGDVPFSKKGVFARDGYRCAYCGRHLEKGQATLDHIIPKSRGYGATWNNSVTACQKDNNRKGNQTPKEAGMPLLFLPYTPTFAEAYRWTHPEV